MKPTELRIGNLVFSGDKVVPIHDLFSDGVTVGVLTKFEYNQYKDISPIPLTGKWLEKLGFEGGEDFKGLYRKSDFQSMCILSESGSFTG